MDMDDFFGPRQPVAKTPEMKEAELRNKEKELRIAYYTMQRSLIMLKRVITAMEKPYFDEPGVPGTEVSWDGKVLKFVIPEVLPLAKYNRSDAARHWIGYFVYAYRKAGLEVKMNHALCMILTVAPEKQPWDADNRANNYVINAIKNLKIVPDDNIHYLTILEAGMIDADNPRTEVYVIEKQNLKNIFQELGVNIGG